MLNDVQAQLHLESVILNEIQSMNWKN